MKIHFPSIRKKLLRKLLNVFSLSAMLFVFQACYGTGQDFVDEEIHVSGYVKSSETGEPIEGIQISFLNDTRQTLTSEDGHFAFYIYDYHQEISLKFTDIDSTENGHFNNLDTTIINTGDNDFLLNILLDPK